MLSQQKSPANRGLLSKRRTGVEPATFGLGSHFRTFRRLRPFAFPPLMQQIARQRAPDSCGCFRTLA
jgi:hypothetical protein